VDFNSSWFLISSVNFLLVLCDVMLIFMQYFVDVFVKCLIVLTRTNDFNHSVAMAAPQGYVTPELLDAATDRKHRSYFSAVLGCSLGQFRARVPMETMVLDPRWLPRFASRSLLCYLDIFNRIEIYTMDH